MSPGTLAGARERHQSAGIVSFGWTLCGGIIFASIVHTHHRHLWHAHLLLDCRLERIQCLVLLAGLGGLEEPRATRALTLRDLHDLVNGCDSLRCDILKHIWGLFLQTLISHRRDLDEILVILHRPLMIQFDLHRLLW